MGGALFVKITASCGRQRECSLLINGLEPSGSDLADSSSITSFSCQLLYSEGFETNMHRSSPPLTQQYQEYNTIILQKDNARSWGTCIVAVTSPTQERIYRTLGQIWKLTYPHLTWKEVWVRWRSYVLKDQVACGWLLATWQNRECHLRIDGWTEGY